MSDKINLTDYILERALSKLDADNRFAELLTVITNISSGDGGDGESDFDLMEIVSSLPTEDIKPNKLYLVYNEGDIQGNLFDVYVYINDKWEQIDSIDWNLNDYYKINEVDSLLRAKASSGDLQQTRNQLTTVRDNLNNLYSNLTEFNEALITFNEDDTTLSNDLTELRTNLETFLTRINNLIDTLTTLESDLSTTQSDLSSAQSDLLTLQRDINGDSNSNPVVKGLKQELSETTDTLTTTRSGLDTARTDIISLQNADQLFTSQLSSFNTDLTTAQTNISNAQSSIANLTSKDVELTSDLATLTTELNTAKTGLQTTQQNISTIQTSLYGDTNDPQDNGLVGDVVKLKSDNTALGVSVGNLWSELTDAQGQLQITSDNLVIYSQELDNFLKDLGTLGDALTNFEGSLLEFKQENSELDLTTFGLDSKIVDLFASIGIVRQDVSTLQEENVEIQENIDSVNTSLYGKTDGSSEDYETESLFGTIDDVYDNITRVDDDISTMDGRLDTVSDTLDSTQGQLEESLGYITNVQKLLYGDSTYYYSCNNQEWRTYNIDCSEIIGNDLSLKFIVYPVNNVIINNITNITNGDFEEDLTGWTVSDNNNINIITINNDKIVNINSADSTLILSQTHIDFTEINSISFNVKIYENMNSEINGGLFVYIGDETDDTGLIQGLTEFKDRLTTFNSTLTGIDTTLTGLGTEVNGLQSTLYGEGETDENDVPYTFEHPKDGTLTSTINNTASTLNGVTNSNGTGTLDTSIDRIDGITNTTGTGVLDQVSDRLDGITNNDGDGKLDIALEDIESLGDDITDAQTEIGTVKNTVYGDNDDPTDEGLVGKVSTVKDDIETVQEDISDITGLIGENDNTQGTIRYNVKQAQDNITSANSNITQLFNNLDDVTDGISDINGDIGNVKTDKGGNLQNQVATVLSLQNKLLNCVVVDTIEERDALNRTYVDYCYVNETGKYYQYAYYVVYYDENDNEVEPTPGTEVILAEDPYAEGLGTSQLIRRNDGD